MSGAKVRLSELDFNDVGAWPQRYKIGFCAISGVLILVLANLIFFRSQRDELEALKHQEALLRTEFASKADRAGSLQPLKRQIMEMEKTLQQILHELPSREEVPDLMVEISQAASSSGLNNELFQPGPEVRGAFYVEKPIALQMVGGYHQLGAFISDVASLPQAVIVTMHDISLQPASNQAEIQTSGNLELTGTVKIYRQMDEDERVTQGETTAQTQSTGVNR